jgi:FAD/FMN-containing dehydrogenase
MQATVATQLIDGFDGEISTPGDPAYDERRRIFNGMIDRRPALIARCTSTGDVAAAVGYARGRALPIAVHGGGHGVPGHAVCDGGVMIDLRGMKRIKIDAGARRVHAQAGLTWGELDAATQGYGLAVTGGRMSTTGVAGFTLGSGSGWLERKLGLAADNLRSAEVVLADGSIVHASEREHPDLFWALRGGGGNFGIVTSFEFALHPVGPVLLGGMLMHPGPRASEVLAFFAEYMADAPDEVGAAVALVTAPSAPFVPEHARGKPAVGIIVCYAGSVEEGERVLQPLRSFGPPPLDMVAPMPYTEVQRLIDAQAPTGLRNYWGGDFLPSLGAGAIEALCAAHVSAPSPLSQIIVVPGGGQLGRVPEDAMALGHRDAAFNTHLIAMWEDPDDDERNIAWLRGLQDACRPHTDGGAFLNFVGDPHEDRVRRALGDAKYERLVQIKDAYDPDNVFRLNHNVRPSAG